MGELFLMQRPAKLDATADVPSIPDASERERALDITRSWVVEAPAGSGKTGLLIQRFLKLLASESVSDPSEVLAITFTRKSTAEMRERVLAQLAAAQHAVIHDSAPPTNAFERATRFLAEAVLARDAQLGWNLLRSPRRLNIQTIDAVCADIAQSLPVLSGNGGGLTPIEDSAPLYAQAAHRTLMLLGGSDPTLSSALELLLLHRDGNLADCEAHIASMLAIRDGWGKLVPLSKHDLGDTYLDTVVLPKFEKALDQAICRSLTRLTQLLPAPILENLCALAAEMAHAEGYQGAPSPIAICKGRNQSPEKKAEDLNHWRALLHLLVKSSRPRNWRRSVSKRDVGFEILKHHRGELKRIIAQLEAIPGLIDKLHQLDCFPPSTYPQEQWVVTKALFHVLSRALVEFQFVFAETTHCDFTEFSLLAKSALSHDEAAAEAITDRGSTSSMHLQHLLVDEMQDTSSSQYELIELLTRHWDGRSQTVFLVGDPKQSIYLFRQARVERFVHTMLSGTLGDLPLGTLHLTANFRSQRNLVQSFNQDFSLLFPTEPDPSHPELVPYRNASAVRPPSFEADRIWHAQPLPYSDLASERTAAQRTQRMLDAAEIRAVVERWRAHPLPPRRTEPWKIAVLVRNRVHLIEIMHAFKGTATIASIPFRAVDIEPLGERQEILDLVALTRALLHPADRTAWLALLRTPWCGLTLVDLHLLAGKDDDSFAESNLLDLMRQRGELLSEDGIARLKPFWTIMDAASKQRGQIRISRWVERTWRAFGAPAFTSAEARTNIEQYFHLLDRLEEPGGALSIPRLAVALKKLHAAPSLHPEAIDLMTIHGAKGLEWDVVFVPALERSAQVSRSRLLSWLEIDGSDGLSTPDVAHSIIAPIPGKGEASRELNLWMRSIDTAREAAERKRLFYVACTRAREELHLFAAPARKKDGDLSIPAGSLLASVWPAAEHLFSPSLPSKGKILPILQPPAPQVLTALAASQSVHAPPPARTIARIPYPASPPVVISESALTNVPALEPPAFERPAGSFAARAFGNAMHAFLELLANRIAKGATAPALLAELPTWSARITSVLRASGLPIALVEQSTASILTGLRKTLEHPDGQWVLAAHPEAASESSHISYRTQSQPNESQPNRSVPDQRSSIRLDRTFLAGSHPHNPGTGFLWIIDYKTANHGREGSEVFIENELKKYRPQLERYARELASTARPIRLALFHPMLARLTWWEPQPATYPAVSPVASPASQ